MTRMISCEKQGIYKEEEAGHEMDYVFSRRESKTL